MNPIYVYQIKGDIELQGTRWIMSPSNNWTKVGVVLFDLFQGEKRMYIK